MTTKKERPSIFIAALTAFGVMGVVLGFMLMIAWILSNTMNKWWQPILGIGLMILFHLYLKLVPKIPTKDERIDILEEKVDSLLKA